MPRKRRSTPKPLPDSGLTRLLKALGNNAIPRFKHPHSGVLLSEQSSYDAVLHTLQDENHPDRYAIVTAALDALGDPA
ncbi:MAG: hypothetical protein AAF267_01365 [Deinococcota bacterium]